MEVTHTQHTDNTDNIDYPRIIIFIKTIIAVKTPQSSRNSSELPPFKCLLEWLKTLGNEGFAYIQSWSDCLWRKVMESLFDSILRKQ